MKTRICAIAPLRSIKIVVALGVAAMTVANSGCSATNTVELRGTPAAGPPPCVGEFNKLRQETERRGKAAKAASERKVPRKEMCMYITTYAKAEAAWVEYTEANAISCPIPDYIVQQLEQVHSHTKETRDKVCAFAHSYQVVR
jgi:hypothetical protein